MPPTNAIEMTAATSGGVGNQSERTACSDHTAHLGPAVSQQPPNTFIFIPKQVCKKARKMPYTPFSEFCSCPWLSKQPRVACPWGRICFPCFCEWRRTTSELWSFPPLSFLDFQAKGRQGFPFYNYFPEKGHAGADWGWVWSVLWRRRPPLTLRHVRGLAGRAGNSTDRPTAGAWLRTGTRVGLKKRGSGGGGQGIFGKWGTAHHSDPVIEMDFENKSQDLAVKMVTRNDPAGKQAAG